MPEVDQAVVEAMRRQLEGAIGDEGGVAWHLGEQPEAEPTALAALALGDDRCVSWLLERQDDDGGFALSAGSFENAAPTALVAVALPEGPERERALDRAVQDRSKRIEALGDYPLAWGWTTGTYSWVEPTARVLLALRLLRPSAAAPIEEAQAMLAERQVEDGGWNYGNAEVFGTDMKSYAQTTALAVLALQGQSELVDRGADVLEELAAEEHGGLSLSQSLLALRAVGRDGAADVVAGALVGAWERTSFLGDQGVLAWALVALTDRAERFVVAR